MEAVMILKCSEPSWAESKRQLGDVNFLNTVNKIHNKFLLVVNCLSLYYSIYYIDSVDITVKRF